MEYTYLKEAYTKELTTTVKSVKDKFVVLEDTIFYPQSGGQPHDTGTITRASDGKVFEVVFVGKFDGAVSHEVNEEGLQQGDEVICTLNWERRYKHMRMHSAAHVLCSILNEKANALISGNQLGEEKTRIDFNTESFDKEKLKEYIAEANDLIKKGANIIVDFMPREEALKKAGVSKLASGKLPDVDPLRTVEIEGIDWQADGGTHVNNISEIGEIEFIKAENKGKSNRRMYIKLKE